MAIIIACPETFFLFFRELRARENEQGERAGSPHKHPLALAVFIFICALDDL